MSSDFWAPRRIASVAQDIPQVLTTFLGLHALPDGANEAAYVDDMTGILPVVAKEKLADFVDAFPEKGFFSLEQSVRFVAEAQKYGLRPKVHSDEMTDMAASGTFCRMGALSVDHLQKINPDAIASLARSNTVATLMPATSFYLGLPYANARALIDVGACVALASDYNPGTAPCIGLGLTHLLAASQMKMSPAEIFCASTVNGALAMGLAPSMATISPGTSLKNVIFLETAAPLHQKNVEDFMGKVFCAM